MSIRDLRRAPMAAVIVAALALAACDTTTDDEQAGTQEGPGTQEAPPTDQAEADGGTPLTDVENVDLELRLSDATIEEVNLDDDEDEFVRFTFTEEIQELESEEPNLALRGFDPEEVAEATSVDLVEDDTRSLIVGFEPGTDVEAFTIAAAEDGVVQDAEGNANIQDTVALSGADERAERRTSAPELVDLSLEQSRNRIEYRFDEQLDEAEDSADASRFGFYTENGEVHTGDDLISIEDEVAVVEFDEEAGDQVEEAARLIAASGAVKDRQGNDNIAGVEGETTAAPDLRSIEPVGDSESQFDFRFDEPVEAGQAEGFALHTEDGTRYTASGIDTVDGRTLRATFRQVEGFSEQVTLAVAEQGSASALDSGETSSTIGVEPLNRGRIALGATAGPDLVAASVEQPSTGRTLLRFDEPVDEDANPAPDRFFIVTESGSIDTAQGIVEVGDEDERFVVVTFPENAAQAAAGFSIDAGAVRDFQDNPNPVGTELAGEAEEGG